MLCPPVAPPASLPSPFAPPLALASSGTDKVADFAHGKAPLPATAPAEGTLSAETLSELVKQYKACELVRLIRRFAIDRAIIFCRTKVDCDNLEAYLQRSVERDCAPGGAIPLTSIRRDGTSSTGSS